MSKKNLLIVTQAVLCIFLLFSSVLAAPTPGLSGAGTNVTTPGEIEISSPRTFKAQGPWGWIESIIGNAMSYFFLIGMILAPLLILIGAFMFLTSAGDASRVSKGKAIVIGASIGLAILLSGRIIMSILRYILDF